MTGGHSLGRKLAPNSLAFAMLQASQVLALVLSDGRSLDSALAQVHADVQSPQARGAIADLSYFGLRWWGRGFGLTQALTGKKKLNPVELEYLLGLSFALLWDEESPKYPAHTVVDQTVNACAAVKSLSRAKSLANACLRNFLRDRSKWVTLALQKPLCQHNYPQWWVDQLRKDHPDRWPSLLTHGNQHAPMVLRVNQRVCTGQAYLLELEKAGLGASLLGPQAVLLSNPVPVHQLPGFEQGVVSVQDYAAQLAAPLMGLRPGMRVLDACAAPGGKTLHMMELADIQVIALDESAERLTRVQANFDRIAPTLGNACELQLSASAAERLADWYDGTPFDAILADLPCSGSGVVRRHPDIRWLRRPADLANLSRIQHTILDALWSTLKPGGTLLLVTCSIFAQEGPLLAQTFAKKHADALPQNAPGHVLPQVEPTMPYQPDGFYYAKFIKANPLLPPE